MKPQSRKNNWLINHKHSLRYNKHRRSYTQTQQQCSHICNKITPEDQLKVQPAEQFPKTTPKFSLISRIQTQPALDTDIKHSSQCMCFECDCGRHLCKLGEVAYKPQLKMRTVYQNSFSNPKQSALKAQMTTSNSEEKSASHSIPIAFSISNKTIYETSFKPDQNEWLIRGASLSARPQDEIKDNPEAPAQRVTTYSSSFIGHSGVNQYIKNVPIIANRVLPFRAKSSYQRDYVGKSVANNKEFSVRAESQKSRNLVSLINRSACVSSYQKHYTNYSGIENTQQEDIEASDAKNDKRLCTAKKAVFKDSFVRSSAMNSSSYGDFAIVSSEKVSLPRRKAGQTTYSRQFYIKEGKAYCPARMKLRSFHKHQVDNIKRTLKDNSAFRQFQE